MQPHKAALLFSTPISLSAIIMSVKSQFSSRLINSIIALCLHSTNTVLKYLKKESGCNYGKTYY